MAILLISVCSPSPLAGEGRVRGAYSNFFTAPLFQRGKITSPPFGVFLLLEAGKGRQGGIFKAFE